MDKRLYKSNTNKIFFGVLGGMGEYFDIDPTLIRIAYCLLTLLSAAFPGLLLYIIMAFIVPKNQL